MGNSIVKGNMDELLEASRNGVVINLLRKSFDGEILKALNIVENSMFARCSFVGTGIYGSTFTGCTFVKCDFTTANFYGVTFNGCKFNECKFNDAAFQMTKFMDESVINNCSFDGVDLTNPDNVSGIDTKDLNVVSEDANDKESPVLVALGFERNEAETEFEYVLNSDDGIAKNIICFDPEYKYYRNMIFVNDLDLQTTDIIDINDYSVDELKAIILNSLKSGIRMLDVKNKNGEIENYEAILSSINNLVEKIKAVSSNTETTQEI